jgi:alpha-ketoglutarate-dependent taurine dioxygenase
MLRQVKKTSPEKFRAVELKELAPAARESWVKTEHLDHGGSLPLVVKPRVDTIDLIDWVGHNRDFVESNLLGHGAILFRGFEIGGQDGFERFARAISPELADYEDQHTPRTRVSDFVYTSTEYPADHYVPFHSENSKNNAWPMKLWFFCVKPADEGGATPIADNRLVYALIDPEIRRRFEEQGVMYVRNFGEGVGLPWQSVFQTNERFVLEDYCRRNRMQFRWKDGDRLRVSHVCQSVARHPLTGEMLWFNQAHLFHVSGLAPTIRESMLSLFPEEDLPSNSYFGDGSRIDDAIIDEIRDAYRQVAVRFPWRANDILIVENMLVAHSREPFSGVRRILVAMAEQYAAGSDSFGAVSSL